MSRIYCKMRACFTQSLTCDSVIPHVTHMPPDMPVRRST